MFAKIIFVLAIFCLGAVQCNDLKCNDMANKTMTCNDDNANETVFSMKPFYNISEPIQNKTFKCISMSNTLGKYLLSVIQIKVPSNFDIIF